VMLIYEFYANLRIANILLCMFYISKLGNFWRV
jgi:hypothetical protein